jgi:hypothetical protein
MSTPPDSPPSPLATSPLADVTLAPRFWVPLGVVGLGLASLALLPLWGGSRWLALVLVLFGLLLALQASQLRLRFEAEALVVLRLEQEIRRFPYVAWLGWRLFWSPLPVLFYFREERSIHLLPLLFDATALQEQLIQRLPPTLPSPSIGKTMPP